MYKKDIAFQILPSFESFVEMEESLQASKAP